MKLFITTLTCLLLSLGSSAQSITGAWVNDGSGVSTVYIITDGFFSVSVYKATEFIKTYGGSYKYVNGDLIETLEFDTEKPDRVGTTITLKLKTNKRGDEMDLQNGVEKIKLTRLDDQTPGKLAGAWLITGRYNNGEMRSSTPGARRTMKILSGTRFQWIAYNVETKEFFGTGGGIYTSVDGKYTETIDFFSRDQSRVGMSLGFDFKITEEDAWRHSGKSSKGDPIDEIWTKREKLGI